MTAKDSGAVPAAEWCHDGQAAVDLLEWMRDEAVNALQQSPAGAPEGREISTGKHDADDGPVVKVSVVSQFQYRTDAAGAGFPSRFLENVSKVPTGTGSRLELVVRRACQPVLRNDPTDFFPAESVKVSAAKQLIVDARALAIIWRPAVRARVVDELDRGLVWEPLTFGPRLGDMDGFVWPFVVSGWTF